MKRICLLGFMLSVVMAIQAQTKDKKKILAILDTQTAAWNRGDVDAFMKGYWENDSLMFIGKSGVTYGWKNTLENYKNGYPNAAAMGQLNFTIIKVEKLSGKCYSVVGKWHLKRTIGDLEGHYTLVFKKIGSEWVIVQDHSS